MARAIDLSTVSPERAVEILRRREAKRREYIRRKETLLARNRAWQKANPETAAVGAARWRTENPEKVADGKRTWYEQNRDLQLDRARRRNLELADSVVKSLYARGTGLQSKDIPADLVAAIRLTIHIKRQIKEQKRELR